jgi:hypothetical protein
MASINASTSGAGGVITTADNTGTLQLQSGGTTIATINSTGLSMASGKVLAPTGPAFSAYKSSAQTITANTYTKVLFETEEFDTNNNFASSRFTPTVAGYYQLNSNVGCGTSGDNFTVFYKNGSAYKFGNYTVTATSAATHNSCLISLNGTTDYVEVYIYSGGTSVTNSSTQTYFDACLVRAA